MTSANAPIQIGCLLYPGMTHLDVTGPHQVLAAMADTKVHTLWRNREPIASDTGLTFIASKTLAECPPLDVLFVGGGRGQLALLGDDEVLSFLRRQSERARFVTAVCTGSLLLGAAGLLQGYRATTHWAFTDLLPMVGAVHAPGRVVVDRNRVTGGGVTAGLDFALTLVALLRGDDEARRICLALEYDPAPPFACGHPDRAPGSLVDAVRASLRASLDDRRAALAEGGVAPRV